MVNKNNKINTVTFNKCKILIIKSLKTIYMAVPVLVYEVKHGQ
jgi:hypothetical protein